MRLIELTLTNFQGIRAMQIGFGGKSASIYGDNATGKTTVYNAITWLLFDRPGNGAKSYTPKTKGPNGDLHYLEHSAEATFLDGDRLLVLKKTFREVYKRSAARPPRSLTATPSITTWTAFRSRRRNIRRPCLPPAAVTPRSRSS